jgi:activator of 2-hydroxyglutaryl-CoA dehydratase/predicted nucleotide-binding protein (sugar kinase/HSP70/actin superfamily)
MKGNLYIGIDVGSTTVKCVVVEPLTLDLLWTRYQRHETHQAEVVAEMLADIERAFPDCEHTDIRTFITGSGAGPIAAQLGSRFVQEVNAVSIAVERLHPDVNSVVELGGQDAKIIIFKENPKTGERQVIASMNDKCASGTGATIDKCLIKLGMPRDELATQRFDPGRLHNVAAKCGVFAETDIVNLIKAGVPSDELMNSLIDAIVKQNLSVLTRGNTLRDKVLLLGGPNSFLPFLQECWRLRIPETWTDRGHDAPDVDVDELIFAPENAQYYAARGAAMFGMEEPGDEGVFQGLDKLANFIANGRKAQLGASAGLPLLGHEDDLDVFRARYSVPEFMPPGLVPDTHIRGYIGFDGGSTSSKAVLIGEEGEILTKQYLISKGNPITDAKEIMAAIRSFATDRQCTLEVLGFGATGYAADVLDNAIRCDANIVETVAHMISATRYCGDDVDVICDIGGQDIKVLFLQNGTVRNFRLSNQCSAGNGMLLQAMADQFGVDIQDYADIAFGAELSPKFSYGCAVFLDTDRVNFQKEGFTREELFAGLARVLPKNIWQYVVQIPRMAELGRKFVLQGGTQNNLAVVKAQVDYIAERVPGAEIMVHPHCGEAGAIGAALEARRAVERRGRSRCIGLDAIIDLAFTTRTDEETRCNFCTNNCSRTFIDTVTPDGGKSRYIAGFSCEKGTVESKEEVVRLNQERKRLKGEYPNLVEYDAVLGFRHFHDVLPPPAEGTLITDEEVIRGWFGYVSVLRLPVEQPFRASPKPAWERRKDIRIGIPRVLNTYTFGPFLRSYLEALGITPRNVVFSDETTEQLWQEGGKYGSIDPCYPSKVSLAHIHNLLHHKQSRRPLDYIWFPGITAMPTFVSHTQGSSACPIVAGSSAVGSAAFTNEKDFFAAAGVEYIYDPVNFEIGNQAHQQLFDTWGERLGVTRDENDWACLQGWEAMRLCENELQRRGLELLNKAEQDNGLVLLMLGRPYHNDPGLNHDVLEEFQTLGYPVLSIRSIPKDPAWLARFFKDDLASGRIRDVFDINDVWPENYSTNSAQKVWAAKFAARHPNVAVLDLSSFKCGNDSPTYGIIDSIIGASDTPYLALHDLDANKPGGSIRLRVKTYAYALDLYKERLEDLAARRSALEQSLVARRRELLAAYRVELEDNIRIAGPGAWQAMEEAFEIYLDTDAEVTGDEGIDGAGEAGGPDTVGVIPAGGEEQPKNFTEAAE